jgi:hypothetical protein
MSNWYDDAHEAVKHGQTIGTILVIIVGVPLLLIYGIVTLIRAWIAD